MKLLALVETMAQERGARHTKEVELAQFLRAQFGLSMVQATFLLCMRDAPDTIGAIAELMHCSRGNLTSLLDRLEKRGLVIRERSAADRRVIKPTLTSEGRRVLAVMSSLEAS